MTLLEVLSLQCMETFELNCRLVLTGIFSILSQGVLLTLMFGADLFEYDPLAVSALLPALRHLTRLSEMLFLSISVLTIALHALAQLIVEGKVTKEIFGHDARWPAWSDE